MWVASPNPLKPWRKQKVGGRVHDLTLLSWDTHFLLPLDMGVPGPQALGLGLITVSSRGPLGSHPGWVTPPGLLVPCSLTVDGGTSPPLYSREPVLIINLLMPVSMYIYVQLLLISAVLKIHKWHWDPVRWAIPMDSQCLLSLIKETFCSFTWPRSPLNTEFLFIQHLELL